ncbi:MAG: tetratricopeptide repeat protein [bacterium]|nr:tetratricopeptide repeat protein [bacterium]
MFKRFITGIGGIAMLVGVAAAGPLEDGVAAYESGDYATALKLWRPLAEQGHAGAKANLGLMYANGRGVPQDLAEALRLYTEAIGIDPDVPNYHNNRAIAFLESNDIERALRDVEEAVRLRGDNPLYLANRCMVQRILGRWGLALSDCNTAVERLAASDDNSWPYFQRAQVYRDMGVFEKAIADFTKSMETADANIVGAVQGFMKEAGLYGGGADGKLNDELLEAVAQCIRVDQCYFPAPGGFVGAG